MLHVFLFFQFTKVEVPNYKKKQSQNQWLRFWNKSKCFEMPKRKLDNVDVEERVRKAMLVPGASETACAEICEVISGKKLRGAIWKMKTKFLQPFRRCLQEIELDGNENSTKISFLVGNPQKLIAEFCKNACFSKIIEEALLKHHGRLTFCLYHDDCIAGNVLGPLKQSKCTFYYGTFVDSRMHWGFFIA